MSWYEEAFRARYLELYRHRDEASARAEAAFAARACALEPAARVLDVACGAGRHARALAALGFRVVGLDLSRDLLARARDTVRVRADMRALPFADAFDAAVSFFTSFGYFDDEGNRATLASAAASLRPGGRFLLDYLNARAVREGLAPRSEEQRGSLHLSIRRRIAGDRVVKEVVAEDGGRRETWMESVRLYDPQDVTEMMHEAGLVPLALHGDFDGRAFSPDAPRCIMVARKP